MPKVKQSSSSLFNPFSPVQFESDSSNYDSDYSSGYDSDSESYKSFKNLISTSIPDFKPKVSIKDFSASKSPSIKSQSVKSPSIKSVKSQSVKSDVSMKPVSEYSEPTSEHSDSKSDKSSGIFKKAWNKLKSMALFKKLSKNKSSDSESKSKQEQETLEPKIEQEAPETDYTTDTDDSIFKITQPSDNDEFTLPISKKPKSILKKSSVKKSKKASKKKSKKSSVKKSKKASVKKSKKSSKKKSKKSSKKKSKKSSVKKSKKSSAKKSKKTKKSKK